MMNKKTLEKMKEMHLVGMARAFQTCLDTEQLNEQTTDEIISFLIESEWDDKQNRNIDRRIKNAHFRYPANVEDIHYDGDRTLDKNQIMRIAECDFIEKKDNVIITGSTGIGKSYIATALGNQACILGYRVIYANANKLFARLKMAKAEGNYLKEINRIERQDLFIIDDFALNPLDNHSRTAFMEILEDRHGKSSTIITSQVPPDAWHELIGERTIADAILDRIVHNAYRIQLSGESLRKRKNFNEMEILN
jgi:DNA replication protein DnaC